MRILPLALLFVALLVPALAQPIDIDNQLRQAAAERYQIGGEWNARPNVNWYTIVPYKELYFASMSGSDENGMDFYSVWEYLDGKWHFIFQHSATDAGPEAEAELDEIYARHRFSSKMRKMLMHGPEKPF